MNSEKCTQNITFKSSEIKKYYTRHRNEWNELYPSEQSVFGEIMPLMSNGCKILDVGCAAGGLGRALGEKFPIGSYTGIDIHEGVVEEGKCIGGFSFPAKLISADFLSCEINPNSYNVVVSLSCADWNIRTSDIIVKCWRSVSPGGYFILSLRLTPGQSCNDFKKSYQFIQFCKENHENDELNNNEDLEKAPYVVFNTIEALQMIHDLNPAPEKISIRGYWGKPSSTAVTPFKKLVFAVIAVKKNDETSPKSSMADISLPIDAFLPL